MFNQDDFQNLEIVQDGGVVMATLNKPENMNALVLEMIQELAIVIDVVRTDPHTKVLVLTGKGKAFSAGGNVKAMGDTAENNQAHPLNRPLWNIPTMNSKQRLDKNRTTGLRIMKSLHELDKPTIAAVNGIAAGAGMDLSLACDVRIAAEGATFRQSYVKVGIVPFDGGMYWLPRLIGMGRALELMYTGDSVDAAKAERIGLVNKVVPQAELVACALELAHRLARGPAVAIQMIKHLTREGQSLSFPEALELYYSAVDVLMATEDHNEAIRALLEKREPDFKGR